MSSQGNKQKKKQEKRVIFDDDVKNVNIFTTNTKYKAAKIFFINKRKDKKK